MKIELFTSINLIEYEYIVNRSTPRVSLMNKLIRNYYLKFLLFADSKEKNKLN